MKKKIRSELVSLAHRILKLETESNYNQLLQESRDLYEKLQVLAFAEKHFDGIQPTIGKQQIIEALQDKQPDEIEEIVQELEAPTPSAPQEKNTEKSKISAIAEANEKLFEKARSRDIQRDDKDHGSYTGNSEVKHEEELYEPVMEKIKDIVAQMPPETDALERVIEGATRATPYQKDDMNNIGEYGAIAEFEEKEKPLDSEKPRSLNDRLNKGLSFGLNDRIAFIKHLFDGNATDYNRVLSQLNTKSNSQEAITFIDEMIKPDYNGWQGKEVYEQRFKDLIEKKLEA